MNSEVVRLIAEARELRRVVACALTSAGPCPASKQLAIVRQALADFAQHPDLPRHLQRSAAREAQAGWV